MSPFMVCADKAAEREGQSGATADAPLSNRCGTCLHFHPVAGMTWGEGLCRARIFGPECNLPTVRHGGMICRFWRPRPSSGDANGKDGSR